MEEYRDVARVRREKVKKVKAQLELNPASVVKDNTNVSYKDIKNKRRAKENLSSLLNAHVSELEDQDGEQNNTPHTPLPSQNSGGNSY